MSVVKFVQSGYEVDATPHELPDGRFVARAVVRRQSDGPSDAPTRCPCGARPVQPRGQPRRRASQPIRPRPPSISA